DLPGPGGLAQSAQDRGRHHRRAVAPRAPGPRQGAGRSRRRADAAGGARPGLARALSARRLRRPAPAHRHRPGHRRQAAPDRGGRSHRGARRVAAQSDARPDDAVAGRDEPVLHLHLPRHVGHPLHVRPGRGDVSRPDRGDRQHRGRHPEPAARLYPGAALGHPASRPARPAPAGPFPLSRDHPVKITDIKVIVCSPGRNFVTVKIMTDQGLYGVGDATLNGREKAVVAYLEEHVIPCLIGRDASRIEEIWNYLYRGAYWRRGPVTMCAIAGIDTALWDIKAKAANMPLYQLLGGASREHVLAYTHAQGTDIAECVDAVGARLDEGFKAVRCQTGIPGLRDVYGTGKYSVTTNAAQDAMPREESWSTPKYLAYVPGLFDRVR